MDILAVIAGNRQHKLMALYVKLAVQRAILPLLQVAYHTPPRAMATCLEYLLIVDRSSGLHQKYLYQGTGRLAKVHAGLNDLGIIENHQCARGQIGWQMVENILAHLAMLIDKQLAVVALGQGELSYPLIGQRVVIITDFNMFCIHYITLKIIAKR